MTEPAHAMAYETGPFFVEADAMFVPQPVTGGPWDSGLLHGVPSSIVDAGASRS